MERLICTKRGPWRHPDGSLADGPAPSYGEEVTPDGRWDDESGVLYLHFVGYGRFFDSRQFEPVDPMEGEIASLLEEQLETA